MKIVFAEPIGITNDAKLKFSDEMAQRGNVVKYFDSSVSDQADLQNRIADADILVLSNQPLSGSTIETSKSLKMISVAFTGVDHLPVDYCKQKGITICNAAGYSTAAVAELTIAMAVSLLRKIVSFDFSTRSGGSRNGILGGELYGKTFGVVGLGAIGTKVAELANAYGCEVIAYNRSKKNISNVKMVEVEELFSLADIVSLHVPATPQTVGMVNSSLIGRMKSSALLINTARGTLVDYHALSSALAGNLIAGAAIDVYEHEPPIESDHPIFSAPNTLLLPHIGFATAEAIDRRTEIVLENIRTWLDGNAKNVVV